MTDFAPEMYSADEFLRAYPKCKAGLDWMDQFVGEPHPALGRGGAICPFLRKTLANGNARYCVIPSGDGSAQAAFDGVTGLVDFFLRTAPRDGPASAIKSLIIFAPDLKTENELGFIKEGHDFLKPYCVKRGLMIGEFHRQSDVGSVHNPDLKVLKSPEPFFVIRHMSVHDLMFLDSVKYPPQQKFEYLSAYKDFVGQKLPPMTRSRWRSHGLCKH